MEAQKVLVPRLVTSLSNIKKVVCGDAHNIVLDGEGRVSAWGYGEMGQLGLTVSANKTYVEKPTLVEFSEKVVDIISGSLQSFFVMRDFRVYGCGLNNQSQLGFKSETEVINRPTRIPLPSNMILSKFRAGCSHCVCLMKENGRMRVYGWGMSKHGQLGEEPTNNIATFGSCKVKYSETV